MSSQIKVANGPTAAEWVAVFKRLCEESAAENTTGATKIKMVEHFLHLPAIVASSGPLIATLCPPVERVFMDSLNKPEGLYADVLTCLILLRKKRPVWAGVRQSKAEKAYEQLQKDLGV